MFRDPKSLPQREPTGCLSSPCLLEVRVMACDPPTQELAFLRKTSTSAWHFGASPLGLREGQRLHFLSIAPAPCSLCPAHVSLWSATDPGPPVSSFCIPSLPKLGRLTTNPGGKTQTHCSNWNTNLGLYLPIIPNLTTWHGVTWSGKAH